MEEVADGARLGGEEAAAGWRCTARAKRRPTGCAWAGRWPLPRALLWPPARGEGQDAREGEDVRRAASIWRSLREPGDLGETGCGPYFGGGSYRLSALVILQIHSLKGILRPGHRNSPLYLQFLRTRHTLNLILYINFQHMGPTHHIFSFLFISPRPPTVPRSHHRPWRTSSSSLPWRIGARWRRTARQAGAAGGSDIGGRAVPRL